METVKIGTLVCEVIRSSRQSIGLRVSPDGAVQILSPRRLSLPSLLQICALHEKKLLQMREKQIDLNEQRRNFAITYGSQVRFFGKKAEVRDACGRDDVFDGDALYIKNAGTDIRFAVISAYKQAAEEHIPARVVQISEEIGVAPLRVRINSAGTHFASCSKKASLNFSWYCMMASPEAIDYVIVHELCHIIHFNHSVKFWSEVEKYCPEYKKYKAELRLLSHELASENWN